MANQAVSSPRSQQQKPCYYGVLLVWVYISWNKIVFFWLILNFIIPYYLFIICPCPSGGMDTWPSYRLAQTCLLSMKQTFSSRSLPAFGSQRTHSGSCFVAWYPQQQDVSSTAEADCTVQWTASPLDAHWMPIWTNGTELDGVRRCQFG